MAVSQNQALLTYVVGGRPAQLCVTHHVSLSVLCTCRAMFWCVPCYGVWGDRGGAPAHMHARSGFDCVIVFFFVIV